MNPSTRHPRIEIAIGLRRAGAPLIDVRAARQRGAGTPALRSYASPEGAALFEAAMDGDAEAPATPRTPRGKAGRG